MAKISEIIYDVREAVKEFSDDSELDDRYLTYLINTKRSIYLRQDLNNFQKTTDLSIQQSYCLELEEVSSNECGVDIDCDKILRSKKVLPKMIELHTKPAIIKVKPTNKLAVPFNYIPREKAPFLNDAPFGNSIYAFLDTDYRIYLISKSDSHKLIDCITITSINENPLDLNNYSKCCNCDEGEEPCFDEFNSEYPLQPHYIDVIKKEIVNDILRSKGIPQDKENDSNDPTYDQKQ